MINEKIITDILKIDENTVDEIKYFLKISLQQEELWAHVLENIVIKYGNKNDAVFAAFLLGRYS